MKDAGWKSLLELPDIEHELDLSLPPTENNTVFDWTDWGLSYFILHNLSRLTRQLDF